MAISTILAGQNPSASEVLFSDGQSFQQKLDSGALKGEKGDTGSPGKDGSAGAPGKDGSPGATGPAGPNTVSTTTTTDISGLLKGSGGKIAAASSSTDYVPPTRTINNKALSGNITISASDISALPLSGGAMSGVINMGNHKITNVTTPTASSDAANKGYVDSQITIKLFDWGAETEIGDENWWANLKTWILNTTTTDLQKCLGKKKKVKLNTSLLGVSSGSGVSMLCVGYNCDGAGNSLTFQTEGLFPTTTPFGASNALWTDSGCTAQNHCNTFGSNCSATKSLKSTTQWYCNSEPTGSRGKSHNTSKSVTCFIPSECQMGWTSTASASNSNGWAMSNDEWSQGGAKTPYQWYNSNDRRVKYKMSSDGTVGSSAGWYWGRSRSYSDSADVCVVPSSGSANYGTYSNSYYCLAPAFVIG